MLGIENALFGVLGLIALGLKIWALADALYRPAPYFEAAGKWSKLAWVAILVAALVLGGADFAGLLGIVSVIAAIVYLVDVRPAVQALKPGNNPYA
ncbi:MAG TPA: DUF2516 family protein [Mycobacteriales bacterium]|nr:DUF2516 family protein [Mycobacteriales bacterium]